MENAEFETLKDDFEFIDDWEERYKYVIELGKAMPSLDEADHTDANKVHGCVSQVWLKSHIVKDENGVKRLRFIGDSDALIVRGLVAILRVLFNDRPVNEVAGLDALAALEALGLNDNLTPQRSNGLAAMIKRLQEEARQAV